MRTLIKSFRRELNDFWKWTRLTSREHEENRANCSLEESNYSNWTELRELAVKSINYIKNGEKSEELVKLILEYMAIDNEEENTLDLCEKELSNSELEYLIERSIYFPLYDARWQIAELIGRKDNRDFVKYLLLFINDKNKYVQRRALLSLAKIVPEKAEEIARLNLNDEDDYLRLVSLRILRDASSKYLQETIDILRNDRFKYIQLEIEEILLFHKN